MYSRFLPRKNLPDGLLTQSKLRTSARGGHTATRIKGSIYVYGGANREQKYFEDVYRLRIASMTWEKVQVRNSMCAHAPRACVRACVRACSVSLCVKMCFSHASPQLEGTAPRQRSGHSAVAWTDRAGTLKSLYKKQLISRNRLKMT
jgi:hypothetical protein